MIKGIIIAGEGGQGIKLIAHTLANILVDLGHDITLTYEYDAAVRGGKIIGILNYSDKKVENPIVETPDLFLKLSSLGGDYPAKKIICETGLCNQEQIPFSKIAAEKFGNKIMMNMIALGRLMRFIDINPDDVDLKKYLPPKFVEKNIEAIKLGYDYK